MLRILAAALLAAVCIPAGAFLYPGKKRHYRGREGLEGPHPDSLSSSPGLS